MNRLLATLLVTFSALTYGDYKEYHFKKTLEAGLENLDKTSPLGWISPLLKNPEPPSIQEGNMEQRLDHNSCCDFTTFQQRYYYDGTLAKGNNSPVFIYICGESTCESRVLKGAMREHAQKVGAHLFALEHRYYGKSQPFEKLTVKNMRYLTTEYALKDLAAFLTFAKEKYGLTGKWVSFGGSYPGSLSAYFREKLPQLVEGAIASSAPVRSEPNFETFDLHVSQVAGEACAQKIREAVSKIEAAFGKPEMAEIKKLFAAEKVKDDTDFLYVVADSGAAAIQYGFHKKFCEALNTEDVVKGYGAFAQEVFKKFGMSAERMSMYEGGIDEDPNAYLEGFGYRQWLYQSCTEYGYWQNAYHDASLSVRSQRINKAYHENLCVRLFGLQSPPQTEKMNEIFYAPLFEKGTSRIYFTNGGNDPWSRLSIVPGADQSSVNPGIELYQIDGAAHCDDLRRPMPTDSAALTKARTRTLELLQEWVR